jgi:hypothetical protein
MSADGILMKNRQAYSSSKISRNSERASRASEYSNRTAARRSTTKLVSPSTMRTIGYDWVTNPLNRKLSSPLIETPTTVGVCSLIHLFNSRAASSEEESMCESLSNAPPQHSSRALRGRVSPAPRSTTAEIKSALQLQLCPDRGTNWGTEAVFRTNLAASKRIETKPTASIFFDLQPFAPSTTGFLIRGLQVQFLPRLPTFSIS